MLRGRVLRWEPVHAVPGVQVPYWEAASVVVSQQDKEPAVPIPAQYVKSAVFIVDGVSVSGRPEGTGFLINAIRRGGESASCGISYLVTCAHVVRGMQEPHVRIRVGRDAVEDWPLEDGPYYHPSGKPGDDVAVFPLRFSPDRGFWGSTSSSMIDVNYDTDFRNKIYEPPDFLDHGQEVFYAGFLGEIKSMDELVPMVRSGIVGAWNQPDILMKDTWGNEYLASGHLIDARTEHGFSGSPCFVQYPEPAYQWDLPATYEDFADLWQTGHFRPRVYTEFFGILAGFWRAEGVGVVVPLKKILETLERKELLKDRKEREAEVHALRDARKAESKPAEQATSRPGPEPERLHVEGSVEDVAKRVMDAGMPEEGDGE